MIQQLGNYFLQPLNLAALSLVLILLVLYLLKPKPQKKMMPSVMFFQEEEEPGKLKQGIRKLLRNKFLFLHILIFSLIAFSLAEPYINQLDESDEATIYLDATANTAENFQEYKNYAQNHLAETNNLVVVGSETQTYTDIAASRANQIISETESTDIRRDLDQSLTAAKNLEGNLFISSNLASMQNSEAQNTISSIAAEKDLQIKERNFENKWGITDYTLSGDTAELYVKNYDNQQSETGISINSEQVETLNIDSNSLEVIEVSLNEGMNNITLSNDDFSPDNQVFIYNPSSQQIKVEASSNHPYIREAVNVIPEASLATEEPDIHVKDSEEASNSDITRTDIENGLNLIYMAEQNTQTPNYLPVQNLRETSADVEVKQPTQTMLPSASYLEGQLSSNTENLTVPKSAIVKQEIGEGTIIQYNIVDNSFAQQLSFPLFWRQIFQDVTGISTLQNSNQQTGETISETTLENQGYRTIGEDTYSASTTGIFSPNNIETTSEVTLSTAPQSLSGSVNMIIFLLLCVETLLIYRERLI